MTTHIPSNASFLGFKATRFRDVLRSWQGGATDPRDLAKRKGFGLSQGACAAFLGEAIDRGFITVASPEDLIDVPSEFRHLVLSPDGLAIATATAAKRSSKERARRALDTILENASRLADDRQAPRVVDQIWVFGSFIDDTKTDVGDLDIVATMKWTDVGEGMGFGEFNRYVAGRYPGVVPVCTEALAHIHIWDRRMLYGKRRDPLVSVNDIGTLKRLHRPCRLVYDASEGGVVDPVDYLHHPDSAGRDDTIRERLRMPGLGYRDVEFEPTSASVYMWAPEIADGLPAIVGARTLLEAELARFGSRELDGRVGFAGVVSTSGGKALFHVTRSVEFTDREWELRVGLETIHVEGCPEDDTYRLAGFADQVTSLVGADILRLADKRRHEGSFANIRMILDQCPRTLNSEPLRDAVRHSLLGILGSPQRELLSESELYGIEVEMSDDIGFGFGYIGLDIYDDDDWEWTSVSREAFEEWEAKLGPPVIAP